ncbi:hypothetical protein BS50DRAFT_193814 [Corynespora cassiicola Philippines]|uniref:Uncharacterized protein n=1 Tax=Corynespora cassiicola Philippines TaxID=1448308 RepID=A0A2T2P7R9_CORCC|nr:hypothetical protein BS50DRAFT_193814 [Corynespora cassiicola Philippines]
MARITPRPHPIQLGSTTTSTERLLLGFYKNFSGRTTGLHKMERATRPLSHRQRCSRAAPHSLEYTTLSACRMASCARCARPLPPSRLDLHEIIPVDSINHIGPRSPDVEQFNPLLASAISLCPATIFPGSQLACCSRRPLRPKALSAPEF